MATLNRDLLHSSTATANLPNRPNSLTITRCVLSHCTLATQSSINSRDRGHPSNMAATATLLISSVDHVRQRALLCCRMTREPWTNKHLVVQRCRRRTRTHIATATMARLLHPRPDPNISDTAPLIPTSSSTAIAVAGEKRFLSV